MLSSNKIRYSVVVATYNRAELLNLCLKALAQQDIKKTEYEVILINDGSTDSTDEIVNLFLKSHPDFNFTYFKQENSGPAKARNVGIKNSKGEIIFFTDDDCVVPADWISKLSMEYSMHPEIAGAGGWYIYPETQYIKKLYVDYTMSKAYTGFGGNGAKMKTENINNNKFEKNPSGNTSNMSYLKKILDEVNGFDELIDFVGYVDWELKKRILNLGYPLLYVPYPVMHLKPLGVKEIIRKFFNQGRGIYHLVKKNPDLNIKYTPFLFIYRNILKNINSKYGNKIGFNLMIRIDLFLVKLGWEYQKLKEK